MEDKEYDDWDEQEPEEINAEADQGQTDELIEVTQADDVEALKDELERSRDQAAEYLEGWQRSRAEFANYKKRVERDQAQLYQTTAGSILKRYLEVQDDLERALKNRPQEGECATWSNGIELIYRKLGSILESEGVKPMDAQGQYFDPNLHEAISSEESDQYESGQIIEVVKRGYLLGDKVLRPAWVRVAR